jgi:hypothetical protein
MTRAKLHRLVDELPDESLDAAAVLLERARDPMIAALEAAPQDDEPLSPDERAAGDEGWAEHRRGETVALDDIRAELETDA